MLPSFAYICTLRAELTIQVRFGVSYLYFKLRSQILSDIIELG